MIPTINNSDTVIHVSHLFQSRNRETYDSNSTLFEPLLGLLQRHAFPRARLLHQQKTEKIYKQKIQATIHKDSCLSMRV